MDLLEGGMGVSSFLIVSPETSVQAVGDGIQIGLAVHGKIKIGALR
jgi:hypothetical protein